MRLTPTVTTRTTCRSCGSADLRLLLDLPPTPPGDHYVTFEETQTYDTAHVSANTPQAPAPDPTYPLDLRICERCGLAQLGTVLCAQSLYGQYLYRTAASLGLVDHFDRYAATVTSRAPSGGFVVDLGSNDGTLLQAFKARGWRVLGIDLAAAIASEATNAGIPTLIEPLTPRNATDRRREYGAATVITANHMIANVDDLRSLLAAVRTWLAPDGLFVFETGYFPDLVEHRLIETIEHEHLSYFTVQSVERILRAEGLTLVAVEHLPVKGGSIRGYARMAGVGSGTRDRADFDTLLVREAQTPMHTAAALADWATRVQGVRDQMQAHLADWQAEGKTVVGYGASVGATTLAYWLGLAPQMQWIADDNPARIGLFTPGHHLPVYASDRLYTDRPDVVIILAHRYTEAILARHARYGGTFVAPLPAFRYLLNTPALTAVGSEK